jgi:glycosyltransferase involved in cell wall biosynthesis
MTQEDEIAEISLTANSLFLSVVMCTRNRAASLERVLNSICKMAVPDGQRWEMVLVDNGSVDETPLVVKRFEEKIPIRRVFEPKAGLSNARNAGVAAALGEYILWTDDDVEVEENWLAAYTEAFRRFADGVVFGGRIIPTLEPPTPVWFRENLTMLHDILALRDFGDDYSLLSPQGGRIPWGANYAVRTAEQRKFLYDPELGVSPGKRRIGEETSVMVAMLVAGYAGYWVPNAKVFHIISPSRQTEKYVRDYWCGSGETFAFRILLKKERSKLPFIWSEGLRTLANIILFYIFRLFLPSRWWLRRLIAVGFHSGALNYALKPNPEPKLVLLELPDHKRVG